MKFYTILVFSLCLILFSNAVAATPFLHDNLPLNNTFIIGGTKLFSINATSSNFNPNTAALHIISQDAFQKGEDWDIHALTCAIAGSEYNCSKSLSFAIVGSDTIEYFYFRANDTDGSSSTNGTASNPFTMSLDRNQPTLSFVKPVNNSYVKGNQTIFLSVTDTSSGVNNNTVQYSFDNSSWTTLKNSSISSFEDTFNSSVFSDNQTITIYGKATDNVGNNVSKKINVTVDNEQPRLGIVSPSANIYGNYVNLIASANDTYSGISKVSYSVGSLGGYLGCTGDNHTTTCSSILDGSLLSNGNHTITFSAVDNAGNSKTNSVNITIDNTKPTIILSTPPQNSYLRGNVTIAALLSNAKNFVQYVTVTLQSSSLTFIDNMTCDVNITTCQYVLDTSKFADNSYTLKATAVNTLNLNIVSPTSVTLDNKAPSISIFYPTTSNLLGTFKIEFSVSDEFAVDGNSGTFSIGGSQGLSCSVQSPGRTMICSINFDSTKLSDGSYTLSMTGKDLAGNTGSASKQITISNSAPSSVQINTGSPESTGSGIVSGGSSNTGSSNSINGQTGGPLDFLKSLNIPFDDKILVSGVLGFVILAVVAIIIFVRHKLNKSIITN